LLQESPVLSQAFEHTDQDVDLQLNHSLEFAERIGQIRAALAAEADRSGSPGSHPRHSASTPVSSVSMATELQSLAKIFNNRLFRIPDYQRGYAWGPRQLADFWSDLQRAGTDRVHYCGQLTIEKAEEPQWKQWTDDTWLIEEADYEPCFVVDGQQRLTTAVILLQCLLEKYSPDDHLAGLKVSELRERYLSRAKGLAQTCLFGYAKDNPSHEFFRTQVLGVPSNEYNGTRTVYTTNLEAALAYFRARTSALGGGADDERLFKALTQRFRFNVHELATDIDVFVAFETMNNRGKALSRLELLKNRLIYLSTLAKGSDIERQKVRSNINAVWRTVYEELGRHPSAPLDDDEFLRAHWVVFFGYDKDEADPLTRFLLNEHFTSERLDEGTLTLADIQSYADSLQKSARLWQRLHFPELNSQHLPPEATQRLVRLRRLGFGVLRPLLLASLCRDPKIDVLVRVLDQAERFLLLVRSLAGTRSHVGEAESYRLANDIHSGHSPVASAASMLSDRVARHFTFAAFQTLVDDLFADDDGKGYYELPALKFVLFEYEEHLRIAAKSSTTKMTWEQFRGARDSVEHVYPQTPAPDEWKAFESYNAELRRLLTHSLGNLVAVSVAKNSALSRRSFSDKKKGTDKIPGFSQGSFSELRIAQLEKWTPLEIRLRGLELLRFIEERWAVTLGTDAEKTRLLKLEFLESPDRAVTSGLSHRPQG